MACRWSQVHTAATSVRLRTALLGSERLGRRKSRCQAQCGWSAALATRAFHTPSVLLRWHVAALPDLRAVVCATGCCLIHAYGERLRLLLPQLLRLGHQLCTTAGFISGSGTVERWMRMCFAPQAHRTTQHFGHHPGQYYSELLPSESENVPLCARPLWSAPCAELTAAPRACLSSSSGTRRLVTCMPALSASRLPAS